MSREKGRRDRGERGRRDRGERGGRGGREDTSESGDSEESSTMAVSSSDVGRIIGTYVYVCAWICHYKRV